MYVGVGYDQAGARLLVLERANDSDVVLPQYPIEHVVGLLEIRPLHGNSTVLHEMLLDKGISDRPV